jgi:RNA polymerase sigma-70 factor, ECF subfamily
MHTDLTGAATWDFRRGSRPQQEETDLIRSIAQGDKLAMDALFAQHRDRLYRFALRLLDDKQGAEDIVSEVFLEVWRHAAKFEERCRVSTWLLAITRNLAFSILRRRPMEELNAAETATIVDLAEDPETAIQNKQHSAILAHCLTKLSPAHREAIDLVYYHGRSINEAAAIMRLPPSTVKTRLFYARKQIAKLLSRMGMRRAFLTAQVSPSIRRAPRPRSRAVEATVH